MPPKSPLIALLRDPSIAPLFAARAAGSCGDGFGRAAILWGGLQAGHGVRGLSLVLACKTLPALFVPAAGLLGDRHHLRRHHVLVAAEVLATATWTALAGCLLTGTAPLVVLCPLAMLAGLLAAVQPPVVAGALTDLARPDRRRPANALLNQSESAGLLVGLVAAGAVVTTGGPGAAAAVKAVLSLTAARLLRRLRPRSLRSRGPETRAGKPLAELMDGWREFSTSQWTWVMAVQLTVVAMMAGVFSGVIAPLHLARSYGDTGLWGGASAWGTVAGGEAFGALIGGFLAARWRPVRPLAVAAALPVLGAIPILLLGIGIPWLLLGMLMALSGACQTAYFVLWFTALQDSCAPRLLSRVSGWMMLGGLALTPVTLLAAGPVVAVVGTGRASVAAGVIMLAAGAGALLSPRLRRFGTPYGQRSTGPTGEPSRCSSTELPATLR